MAAEAAGDEAAQESAPKLRFLDLPTETQQEIISHCSQSDLICIALVSKRFHELASTLLYRNFHIIFPDDDDLNFDSPIDGLAGGLDTFTTSEYDYAKHLKDLSMDTLTAGGKGEQSYQSYLYSSSCGKFLNTLLYLTLKRSRSLEAFKWNIRVELSRPVYQELHRISSLKKLHLRMQAGESYYNPPPPLPVSIDTHAAIHSNHWPDVLPGSPEPFPLTPLPVPAASPLPLIGPPPGIWPPSKAHQKNKSGRRGSAFKEPATLAGFKNLKSLSVLDIDNLELVTELKTCVRNSISTLSELQLSLSDSLALQARKPPPDSDPEDSDVDDEFQVVPASQNTSYDASGPAKAFRAQEEYKIQEAVLGRIFDIEPFVLQKRHSQQNAEDDKSNSANETKGDNEKGEKKEFSDDPREQFITSIRGVSDKLMALMNGSRDFSVSQQDILATIEKAARKYVESGDLPANSRQDGKSSGGNTHANNDALSDSHNPSEGQSSQLDGNTEVSSSKSDGPGAEIIENASEKESKAPTKMSKRKGFTEDVSPEDIDIEHLDIQDDASDGAGDDTEEGPSHIDSPESQADQLTPVPSAVSNCTSTPKMTPGSSTAGSSAMERAFSNLEAQRANFETLLAKMIRFQSQADALSKKIEEAEKGKSKMDEDQFREAQSQLRGFGRTILDIQNEIYVVEAEIEDVAKQLPHGAESKKLDEVRRNMDNYIRDTRGLSLETLSLHLVPIKASVLSRAIHLPSLKRLTLLNVGNQNAVWTLLAKENQTNRLALRSVFTDNVSTAFLNCMSQLDELHDLFMLERSTKHKPESFASRSTVTIDQIRRLVLKKHMGTLKRLMIKDDSNGSNWDANEKAMIHICTRGIKLEELAVSMNIHAVHAFMQYFSGLLSLRAINILHFKNNDTCIWVMRETLRFIVDNLSHHPELKLEWIAMEDDRVDRVVRPSELQQAGTEGREKRDKSRDKGKAPATAAGDAFPALPMDALDSESESDEDSFDSGTRLRFKTMGPLQFYDVWGVKIFEKEIRSGRL